MLVTAKMGVWCLEQPGSSVLEFYPAWTHMLYGTCAVMFLAVVSSSHPFLV